jgi:hypothetical protein
MTIRKQGQAIHTLDDWKTHAPPKSDTHWVEGRSAMELARAWIGNDDGQLPEEVARMLAAHPDFGAVQAWIAEPEARLPFDEHRGEPRNADLCIVATDARGDYLIAVEGKADEPFGQTVGAALAQALEAKVRNPASRALERIAGLAQRLFDVADQGDGTLADLRYQLLTATAGAASEARRRGLRRVVMLVHEFVTPKTVDDKHRANDADYQHFLRRLHAPEPRGGMVGPVTMAADDAPDVPAVYFAKRVRRSR